MAGRHPAQDQPSESVRPSEARDKYVATENSSSGNEENNPQGYGQGTREGVTSFILISTPC